MKILCVLLALVLLAGCSETGNPPAAEEKLVSFDVYAVNDLHGKLDDTEFQPGVDELSTYLKQAGQERNTILLATGDMWQGASESNLTGGLIVTEWMNQMDFAAMTMGGHEFDWGQEQICQNRELAEFPFLGINIYSRETDKQVDYCQSSVVVEIEGAQIGIIGAIGNCYYSIASDKREDIYFITGDALTALVREEAKKLRSAGVDFIIYAIHDGSDQKTPTDTTIRDTELKSYYDIALSEGDVDLVFEADTHYRYALTDRYGVYHLQAGGNNNGISHARVLLDLSSGESTVYAAELVTAPQYQYLTDDPVVAQLMEKYSQQIAPSTRILGTNSQYRSKDSICQLVADLYCEKGIQRWGEEYDIVLGGGYISCRSPGYLPKGEVSYSQLMSLLPFDNAITLCSIRGRDLISRFLETELDAYYIKTTVYGDALRIDPDALYYVVTDTYSANYTYNHMTVIDTYDPDVFARDLVADYISAGGLQH